MSQEPLLFFVEHAKSSRSTCKETKQKIDKGQLRIVRQMPPRDEDSPAMNFNYSLAGFTDMLAKARKVKIEDPASQIACFGLLSEEDQQLVIDAVEGVEAAKERIKAERAAKRKAKASASKDEKANGSPAKRTKAAKKPAKKEKERPTLNPDLPVCEPGQTYKPKEVATMLLAHCRSVPDMDRTLPADDAAARKKLGGFIVSSNPEGMQTGIFDLEKAFNACVEGGVWKPKTRAGLEAVNPKNQALITAFEELASYSFKESVFKGNNVMKAARAMAQVPFKITSGVALSKGAGKLPGVGKSTATKIDQFLETGEIEALEAFKAAM